MSSHRIAACARTESHSLALSPGKWKELGLRLSRSSQRLRSRLSRWSLSSHAWRRLQTSCAFYPLLLSLTRYTLRLRTALRRRTWPSLNVVLLSSDSIANQTIGRSRQNHSMDCLVLSLNPELEQRHYFSNQILYLLPRMISAKIEQLLAIWHLLAAVRFPSIDLLNHCCWCC